MGYPIAFLDRQYVLRTLYQHLEDKSKVQLEKRVSTVEHVDTGVIVHCEDGSEYAGDIVAGADGIHSRVRSEMRRYVDSRGPPSVMDKDKASKLTLSI